MPTTAPQLDPAERKRHRTSHARDYGPGFIVKLVLMAAINALGVYGLLACWNAGAMGLFWGLLVLLIAADYVYFSKRALPGKYIYPGLAFLLVFQIFVVGYTVYVSFTNFGDGHNGTKEQAVTALLAQNERRVEGSASYPITVVENDGELGFALVTQDVSICAGAQVGDVCVGTADEPLARVDGAQADGGTVTSVPGWRVLTFQEIVTDHQREVTELRVPVSEDPESGSIRTTDGRNAFAFMSSLEWDEDAGTMTDVTTGTVYSPNDRGMFEAPDGSTLNVGWRVNIGFENYITAFTDARYSGPFVRILVWTIAFAFLSVVTTFLLGLLLAIVFNDERLKGRKIYRTLMIFPYAIPGFLAALIWSGMLNRSFGFINQVLLGGAAIPWLTDPWLARLSVLGVNLWLGFPYMFLICTGALQSLPGDVMEAAKVDGAGKWRQWKSITMPLLLVSTAPLLISSFAFNFNNFTLIYMLTRGGPRFSDVAVPLGHTDILISMVYSVSGLDGTAARNFGLASALSIVIFIIVGTISAIGFRQTRKLEEVM
ncbi:ABC transporter permease subunit [Xylanimonas allomyrinae]|uniref:Maltose/maltodextrin transport system permease protein n=1 Tax=Xylanimonas allomyrinae TaxID=2509459 RepID=A0A4P6EK72_9MICO|nr:ABC transporter permease subunit [Xylanimonas allomyrinae]QAY63012.1 ABC transporter permease subunit [Xylanimonas allomyrinae]